ncbi:hypothetical protein IQ227_03145 [Anabaena aphanizomenioides LEGE 00250]|uniref:Uncharacterized protein n=1 Tax=Sphaerospermopsis aphanizomenoides LEGE 00250 TaxID=2777972 RepID=A0ABR9VAB5_9CYAN|nr:hypothetical protein [Sphaerospermopsis aphanizomenoides]MBE9235062.1 hypothetical protein [Sphaerospermopsis aphanizomenoides LEGE 00250]
MKVCILTVNDIAGVVGAVRSQESGVRSQESGVKLCYLFKNYGFITID